MKIQDQGQVGCEKLGPVGNNYIQKHPHSSIGALQAQEQSYSSKINQVMMGNKARGTGFLISPNLVLTVAHNCFSKKIGIKNKNFKFYEASINESRSSSDGFIIGTKVKFPQKYQLEAKNKQGSQDDYALIKLNQRVEQTTPYDKCLALTPYCQQCKIQLINQKILQIYGYPAEQSNNYQVISGPQNLFRLKQEGITSKKGQNRLLKVNFKNQIGYNMTTFKGQSGSPVIYDGKTIAIHIKSCMQDDQKSAKYNVGRLFTLDVLKNLKLWGEQMGADPFQIEMENACHHLKQNMRINKAMSKNIDFLQIKYSPNQIIKSEVKNQHQKNSYSYLQIPQQYNFDEVSLNQINQYPKKNINFFQKFFNIFEKPKNKSYFMLFISFYKKKLQVQRSITLTLDQKKQKTLQLDNEFNSLHQYCSNQYKDSSTIVSRYKKLTNFQDQKLPPEIKTLDLEGNEISSIGILSEALNFLNLQFNQIKDIHINRLTSLTVLLLGHNKINRLDLASNQNLAFISLQSNCLQQLHLPKRGRIAVLWVSDNSLRNIRFFYNPLLFSNQLFSGNCQGCSITIGCQNKDSIFKKTQQFKHSLEYQYSKYKYKYTIEIIKE